MDTIKTVMVAVTGLALACMGAPVRSHVGVGANFSSMHGRIRGDVGGAQRGGPGRRMIARSHGPVIRNVSMGDDSLHRPWVGSMSYERKKSEAAAHSATLQMKQEAQSIQRQMDAAAESERRRQASERRQAEQRENLAAAKAEIRSQRQQRAAAHQAFLKEQTDEIRRRAAEQESLRQRRLAEQEAKHDRILAELKPCRAYNADGSVCTRKANPGLPFCHLHVGYSGPLQPCVAKPAAAKPALAVQVPKESVTPKPMAAAPTQAPDSHPVAIQPIVVQTPAVENGSSMERSLILVIMVLAIIVCLTVVGGMTIVCARLLPHR